MTLEAVRTQARLYSRMEDTALLTDAQLNSLIQDSVTEFTNDVGGFSMQEYPAISAKFSTRTNFALRVTVTAGADALAVTDVAITATDRDEVAGSIVAADLQTALRAAGAGTITVTYANFAFTVTAATGCTNITFAAPTTVTYASAVGLLGLSGSTDAATVTGSFPDDCTIRYTLPSDLLHMERIEWEGDELIPLTKEFSQSPQSFGTPYWYNIRGRELSFVPPPTKQGMCEVWYRGHPRDIRFSGYQELGLSAISDESSSGLSAQGYKVGLSINGATSADVDVTIGADDTWAAVIILLNTATTGATWAIVDGDLRLTSDAITGVSTIAIVAGQSVDLLTDITGFTAVDTAVAGDTVLPTEIPGNYHMAIPWLAAYKILMQQFEVKLAPYAKGEYHRVKQAFRLQRHLQDTSSNTNSYKRLGLRHRYTVTI